MSVDQNSGGKPPADGEPPVQDSASAAQDPRVLAALKEYQRELDAGAAPGHEEFLGRYPEIGAELRAGLEMLQWMQAAARIVPVGAAASHVGEELGDYRIVREIGRGGMGVVYEAVQQSLGRQVALKVLPLPGITPLQLERFRREAQAAACLHHTNIVPVFGVGEDRGIHYYAMQFIRGQSLDLVLRQIVLTRRSGERQARHAATDEDRTHVVTPPHSDASPDGIQTAHVARDAAVAKVTGGSSPSAARSHLSTLTSARQHLQWVAKVGLQVAEGLDHAHRQNILHRDIKPANLLLDEQGTVWITDFGLAKVEGPAGLTRTGMLVGTLRYLAPERFRGQADARADVYSLGLTLYELATLRPAFTDSDEARLVDRILHEHPPLPRQIAPAMPRDLETILLKSIDKDPAARYPSARALAADLRRFIEDQPILARRHRWHERTWRWCRRKPALATTLSLLTVALLAVASLSVLFGWTKASDAQRLNDANVALNDANTSLQQEKKKLAELLGVLTKAQKDREQAYHRSAELILSRGLELCQQGRPADGMLWLADALRIAPADAKPLQHTLRQNLAAWNSVLLPMKGRLDLAVFLGIVDISPNFDKVVAAKYLDPGARLWDLSTGQPVGKPFEHEAAISSVVYSPAGDVVATVAVSEGTIRLWRADTGQPEGAPILLKGFVKALLFAPDGKTLVTLSSGKLQRWETATGKLLGVLAAERPAVARIHAGADRQTMLAVYDNGNKGQSVQAWDLSLAQPLGPDIPTALPLPQDPLACAGGIVLYRDAKFGPAAAVASTGQPRASISMPKSALHWTLSPDGQYAAFVQEDKKVRLWKTNSKVIGNAELPHAMRVTHIAFAAASDTPVVITASGQTAPAPTEGGGLVAAKGEVRLWTVVNGIWSATIVSLPGAPLGLRVSADGHLLMARYKSALKEGLAVWEMNPKALRPMHDFLDDHKGRSVDCIAFSPDGKTVVSGGRDKFARLWDVSTGEPRGQPLPHRDEVWAVAFNPDGKLVLTGGGEEAIGGRGEVRFWDGASGLPLTERIDHDAQVVKVGFSADGKTALTADYMGNVRLWQTADFNSIGGVLKQPSRLVEACFSQDGTLVLTAGPDELRLWDARTGAALGQPLAPGGKIIAAGFKDRDQVVAVLADRSIRRWNTGTGSLVGKTPPAAPGASKSSQIQAIVVPGGGAVLFCEDQSMAQLWDSVTGKPLGPPRGHNHKVKRLILGGDNRTVLSLLESYRITQMWDALTGYALGPPLHFPNTFTAAAFSPDGAHLITGTVGGQLQKWDRPQPICGDPEHVRAWVETQTGKELDSLGEIRELSIELLHQRKQKLKAGN